MPIAVSLTNNHGIVLQDLMFHPTPSSMCKGCPSLSSQKRKNFGSTQEEPPAKRPRVEEEDDAKGFDLSPMHSDCLHSSSSSSSSSSFAVAPPPFPLEEAYQPRAADGCWIPGPLSPPYSHFSSFFSFDPSLLDGLGAFQPGQQQQ
jgi:hypothetical protein